MTEEEERDVRVSVMYHVRNILGKPDADDNNLNNYADAVIRLSNWIITGEGWSAE